MHCTNHGLPRLCRTLLGTLLFATLANAPWSAANERTLAAPLEPARDGAAANALRSTAEEGVLELRAVSRDGAGIAGVRLDVVPHGARDPWCAVRSVRTDATGNVVVDGLPAGRVQVFSTRIIEDSPSSTDLSVRAGATTSAVLHVTDEHAFEVLTLGPGDLPLPHTGVWFGAQADLNAPPDLITDADGFARLDHAEFETFTAFHSELGLSESAAYAFMTGLSPHRIWLRPCVPVGRVAGVVHDAAGAPVVGARVRLGDLHPSFGGIALPAAQDGDPRSVPLSSGETNGARTSPARFAFTNARGEFVFERVPVGEHGGGVRAPADAPGVFAARVTAGATTQVAVRLERGARVAGHVRDAQGRPVAGVCVQSVAGNYVWNAFPLDTYNAVTTSEDGAFLLERLPPGSQELRAWTPDGREVRAFVSATADGAAAPWDPVLR
jgi:hypothetical protein